VDRFNTPWRVTSAAIYTTPTDSRVYGTLDIDVTNAKRFLEKKRAQGMKITMTHLATAVLARAVAFDVPEMNCFIRFAAAPSSAESGSTSWYLYPSAVIPALRPLSSGMLTPEVLAPLPRRFGTKHRAAVPVWKPRRHRTSIC
jgi:hypothetical protein